MIKFEAVGKKFGNGVNALSDINLFIDDGEFVFIVGPSGAGKTTFFRLLTKEILPTTGQISVDELNLDKLPKSRIPLLRRRVATAFQDIKLINERTIRENVGLVLEILNKPEKEIKKETEKTLELVGLANRAELFPLQLSGGELQRAAIARAMVAKPSILLADEPTGNLDPTTSWEILKLLGEINKTGVTVIIATHNAEIVNNLKKRVIFLSQGKVVKDEKEGKYETF